MPLSRLENFLKNAEGNILYVNPSDFDATDSFENQGNSLTRPFKTIQRALIEAARFSYQQGKNNDKIDRTTILVYPGTHYIDNRPGFSIQNISGSAVYKKRVSPTSWQVTTLEQFSEDTRYDILDSDNDLYKFNSVNGGAILPRGTSIIGLDLRKTKIRPLYVPDPEDNSIDFSSIFNVTGTCYFTAFTFFDADLSKTVFKDYSDNRFVPNFSHHKLVSFAYGDGVNLVKLGSEQTDLTDLDMYYYKVARAYGDITGRGLSDYPVGNDFEPSVDEYRIVGSLDPNPLGISSIRAGNGDGTGDLSIITVTTADRQTGDEKAHNLFVDSPILVSGITVDSESYNGNFTVKEVVGLTTFTYKTTDIPGEPLPSSVDFSTGSIVIGSDTVNSASPYVFNCSIRSVYGLCGMWADGSKATGFKSMVVAQFTGVSLQRDDNAFIVYDNGTYYDNYTLPENSLERPLHTNSRAIYKPDWENFHIRASNDSFIQCVSVFAIGYSKHFLTESGGDMSITNSNSNFGAIALQSDGFKPDAFDRDDVGYITHVIPPREVVSDENEATWLSLDVQKIINSADPKKLYIYTQTNPDILPVHEVDGYRIGAKDNDELHLTIIIGTAQTTYSSPILMPANAGEGVSAKKKYTVDRTETTNNIVGNILTFTENHKLINGEKIRLFSDSAQMPVGLTGGTIYYAITTGLGANQIKLAISLNDAIANVPITNIGDDGGVITVVSSVSDKLPGEIGHPIQYDTIAKNWYITGASTNQIYTAIVNTGFATLGNETASTFFKRKQENRSIEDRVYKLRYVIPKEFTNARPPQAGFIIQETKTVGVSSLSYTNDNITNTKDLKNEKVIVDATASTITGNNQQIITITTELPHNFTTGDIVSVRKIRSTNNPNSLGITSTYNGDYEVTEILDAKRFRYVISGVSTNPGTFTNDVNARSTRQQRDALPLVSRKEFDNTFFVYRVSTIKKHIPGSDGQDGIYHITALTSNVSPSENVGFNLASKNYNQDVRNLYPQVDRDNFDSDPETAVSFADLEVIGKVLTDDKRHSITKEALSYFAKNTRVGMALTGVSLSGVGNTTITVNTEVEHQLNSIRSISFSPGAGYQPSQTYYARSLTPVVSNGSGATFRVTTNASGQISGVTIVDPGSGYATNNTFSISGGTNIGIVTVTSINSNVNNSLELNNFIGNPQLNNAFRITSVPNSKTIVLNDPVGITTYTPNTNGSLPYAVISSHAVGITSIRYTDVTTGIATVTTSSAHGLLPGNKFRIVGSGVTAYDGNFVVKENISLTQFNFDLGEVKTIFSSTRGNVLKRTISSNALNIGTGEENLGSRASYLYAGISTTTSANLTTTSTTVTLTSPNGFKRGDYIVINSEVLRIASAAHPFTVIRGCFGTYKTTASSGTVVKKIKVLPVQLHRPSFMRASGHTFEYLGYGPGNYSTGMPQKQDRILSEDEVLTSQAREQKGGTVVYTGMNDLGEFYSGTVKFVSSSGENVVIEAPIITFTGDDAQGETTSSNNGIFDDVLVKQRLTVEGGENNNQTSQFYGPVNFTRKVVSTSDDGITTKNFFLKGNATQPKLITVGISTPTDVTFPSPRGGDISLLSTPTDEYAGHIRVGNDWKRFAPISKEKDSSFYNFDKLTVNRKNSPATTYDFEVTGNTQLQNLRVTGDVIFEQPQTLGNVSFESVIVKRTARFTRTGLDPLTGLTTTYTQIHESGISRLNDLEVVGISTFSGLVDANAGATIDNIRIGIADNNEIDTSTGNLTIDSAGGKVTIDDNLDVNGNIVALSTTFTIRTGIITAQIDNSRSIELGVGSTNGSSFIDFHNDDRVFPDYGLRIIRNAGIGSVSSEIIHRGREPLFINAFDSGSEVRILTNNTERIRVGFSGTITTFQNNNGKALKGSHLKLNQSGTGDVVISWDITNANANRRWYAGIHTSDGYAWKLACPPTTLQYGFEDFGTASETKLKVDTSGNISIGGSITMEGGRSLQTLASGGTFDIINQNITTINAFGDATQINMGATTTASQVFLRGQTESTTKDSGALVVNGGVGIEKNLYVGSLARIQSVTQSTSTSSGALVVSGGVGISSNLYVGELVRLLSTTDSTSKDTGALVVDGGVGIEKALFVGTTLSVTSNTTLSGTLAVTGATTLSSTLSVASDFSINTNRFNVTASNGNTSIAGTLTVTGNTTLNANVSLVGAAAAATELFRVQNNAGTDRFTVDSFNGNTSISGTLAVTGATTLSSTLSLASDFSINTNRFNVTASNGNTSIAGTLTVTGNTTLNSNVTIVGSDTASQELFKIQNNSGTDRFVVDSANGNTTISGTLGVTGATTLSSTLSIGGNLTVNTDRFVVTASNGNTSIAGTLTVTGNTTLNSNVTMVGAAAAATEVFRIQNSSATDRFTVDSFNGNTAISGTLAVTGATTLSSTLSVTSATTLSSTLTVTDNATFNRNLTVVGSDTASTDFFKVQNNSGSDRFVVDSANGNTTISGTLSVTGATSLSSTLTVTDSSTFNKGVTINGSTTASTELFRITDGSSSTARFQVDSANGNTSISGTLTVTDDVTVNKNLTLIGSSTASTEFFKVKNASSTDTFVVDSANGNTTVSGTLDVSGATDLSSTLAVTGATTLSSTLSVTDNATFGKNVTINGSTTASTELFKITDGSSTTAKFQVDSANGNTTIAGTASISSNATVGGTLGVTGNFTVNTDKFSVTASSGNTTIAGTLGVSSNTTIGGTLGVTGNFTINTDKFSVTASSGNTSIAGTLGVSSNATVGGTLGVTGNFTINTNKFSVTASSGNTTIAGTLGVTGNTTLSGTLAITSNLTVSNTFSVTASSGATSMAGYLTVGSGAQFNGELEVRSGSSRVWVGGDGNIELYRSGNGGAFIDFRRGSSTEDYNARIDNFTSGAITITNSSGTGNLRVQNDIIAFVSDMRLKTNINNIENALDKVCKLNGFTYNFNETAISLGFSPTEKHIGVSAQEVKEVAPEAIRVAPVSDIADEEYMTVQYDKLVPLLIEAIKELKAEVEQLKNK